MESPKKNPTNNENKKSLKKNNQKKEKRKHGFCIYCLELVFYESGFYNFFKDTLYKLELAYCPAHLLCEYILRDFLITFKDIGAYKTYNYDFDFNKVKYEIFHKNKSKCKAFCLDCLDTVFETYASEKDYFKYQYSVEVSNYPFCDNIKKYTKNILTYFLKHYYNKKIWNEINKNITNNNILENDINDYENKNELDFYFGFNDEITYTKKLTKKNLDSHISWTCKNRRNKQKNKSKKKLARFEMFKKYNTRV